MKYQKKPIIVDAIQWTGDNFDEVCNFVGTDAQSPVLLSRHELLVYTLEGVMHLHQGYYILKGIAGEIWGVREDLFNLSYDPLPDAD